MICSSIEKNNSMKMNYTSAFSNYDSKLRIERQPRLLRTWTKIGLNDSDQNSIQLF